MKIGTDEDYGNMLNEELPDHKIKDHVDTLHKAAMIQGDSKLMGQLKPHIEKHKAAAGKITSIEQLKAVAKKKISEPDQE